MHVVETKLYLEGSDDALLLRSDGIPEFTTKGDERLGMLSNPYINEIIRIGIRESKNYRAVR